MVVNFFNSERCLQADITSIINKTPQHLPFETPFVFADLANSIMSCPKWLNGPFVRSSDPFIIAKSKSNCLLVLILCSHYLFSTTLSSVPSTDRINHAVTRRLPIQRPQSAFVVTCHNRRRDAPSSLAQLRCWAKRSRFVYFIDIHRCA